MSPHTDPGKGPRRGRRPRFAILTSGGDAPGMNAVLAGATEAASAARVSLMGIPVAFEGLAEGRATTLHASEVRAAAGRSGTLLGTSRRVDLRRASQLDRCVAAIGGLRLDGLIVVGGSGSVQAVRRLRARVEVPIAFVPGTIDNDVAGTELSIGFDSAVNHGLAFIDHVRISAASLPGRAFMVEVLGGGTGNIARAIARATPVDAVLTPETAIDYPAVAGMVAQAMERGYALIVMSEGVGAAIHVAGRISKLIESRVRTSVLGHSQRGAAVSALDRTLGLEAGRLAVQGLLDRGDVDIRPTLPGCVVHAPDTDDGFAAAR